AYAHGLHALLEAEVGPQRAHYARHSSLCQAVAHDGVQELVADAETPGLFHLLQPVGVAAELNTDVSPARPDPRGHGLGMERAHALVDVETIGLAAVRKCLSAQFTKDVGRDLIGGAMRGIDHDLHARQIELVGEGAFAEFDVAARGIVDAPRPAQRFGADAAQRLIDGRLDLHFDFVGQLHALDREELGAVVLIGIVPGADDHACRQAQRAGEISHRGRGHRPRQQRVDSGGRQPCLERRLEHIARYARVLAYDHRGPAAQGSVLPGQTLAAGMAKAEGELRVDGGPTDFASHPVGAEAFALTHPETPVSTVCQTLMASTVCATACTRNMAAPRAMPAGAPAMLPPGRWSG